MLVKFFGFHKIVDFVHFWMYFKVSKISPKFMRILKLLNPKKYISTLRYFIKNSCKIKNTYNLSDKNDAIKIRIEYPK